MSLWQKQWQQNNKNNNNRIQFAQNLVAAVLGFRVVKLIRRCDRRIRKIHMYKYIYYMYVLCMYYKNKLSKLSSNVHFSVWVMDAAERQAAFVLESSPRRRQRWKRNWLKRNRKIRSLTQIFHCKFLSILREFA